MEILARDRKYQNFPFISTFFYHMQLKGAFSSWNEVAGVHKNNRPTSVTFEETQRSVPARRIEDESQSAGL